MVQTLDPKPLNIAILHEPRTRVRHVLPPAAVATRERTGRDTKAMQGARPQCLWAHRLTGAGAAV